VTDLASAGDDGAHGEGRPRHLPSAKPVRADEARFAGRVTARSAADSRDAKARVTGLHEVKSGGMAADGWITPRPVPLAAIRSAIHEKEELRC
jgi:hypothetical protein